LSGVSPWRPARQRWCWVPRQTIYIKFDGFNPDTNANPPYVGVFTLEWKQIS
jgi:hypothetical protein